MKDNTMKAINILTFLLSITMFIIPIAYKIEDQKMPQWFLSVAFLAFSMCVVSIVLDRIVTRINCLEEQLQKNQTEAGG